MHSCSAHLSASSFNPRGPCRPSSPPPLLSPPNTCPNPPHPNPKPPPTMEIEAAFQAAGAFGAFQQGMFVMLGAAAIPSGMQTLVDVFATPELPPVRCADPADVSTRPRAPPHPGAHATPPPARPCAAAGGRAPQGPRYERKRALCRLNVHRWQPHIPLSSPLSPRESRRPAHRPRRRRSSVRSSATAGTGATPVRCGFGVFEAQLLRGGSPLFRQSFMGCGPAVPSNLSKPAR